MRPLLSTFLRADFRLSDVLLPMRHEERLATLNARHHVSAVVAVSRIDSKGLVKGVVDRLGLRRLDAQSLSCPLRYCFKASLKISVSDFSWSVARCFTFLRRLLGSLKVVFVHSSCWLILSRLFKGRNPLATWTPITPEFDSSMNERAFWRQRLTVSFLAELTPYQGRPR